MMSSLADGGQPRVGGWIQTFTGRQIWPLDARADEVTIEDIAHALANTCRYGGHCLGFYSVAQHSVLVSRACKPEHSMTGLLHDASEAYLGDMPRPIKHAPGLESFRAAEHALERLIAKKFGLVYPFPKDVDWADKALLVTEKRDLLHRGQAQWTETEWLHGASAIDALHDTIIPMAPADAEFMFLRRYHQLLFSRYDGGPDG